MKPYYEEKGITIYHGDCREILPSLPKVDAVITDPPYGFGSYNSDVKPTAELMVDVMVKGNTAAVFGYPEALVSLCMEIGRTPTEWVTWWPTTHKARGVGDGLPRESEHIAIFGKINGRAAVRPRKQDSWARNVAITRGLDPDWCRDGDVWTDAAEGIANNGGKEHPNAKPLSLLRRLVKVCSPSVSDAVLDPFMGSGTTLRAAKDLGRQAIGIEIEEKYCEIAANRLRQEVLQFA